MAAQPPKDRAKKPEKREALVIPEPATKQASSYQLPTEEEKMAPTPKEETRSQAPEVPQKKRSSEVHQNTGDKTPNFPFMPSPEIKRPAEPDTANIPKQTIAMYKAQLKLALLNAETAYTQTVAGADAGKAEAEGAWLAAQEKLITDREGAESTAKAQVQQAVATYHQNVNQASNDNTCPPTPPPDAQLLIFWNTLMAGVAAANATQQTTVGQAEATWETARGTFFAAIETYKKALQSAEDTLIQQVFEAQEAYYTSINTELDQS